MRTRHPNLALAAGLSLIVLAACNKTEPAPAPAPVRPAARAAAAAEKYDNGEDLITAMHDRYASKWFRTMTFTQKTSRLTPDGKWNVQTWYEALRVPGRLRIDFDPVSAGNGVLYARDSQFVVQNGRAIKSDPGINPLLLLGFDVYGNAPSHTAAHLRKEGFDLSRVHASTFEGRPMIVVGANKGEHTRKQFWVDADRLVFVRLLEPTARDASKMQDIRFVNYMKRGDAWVAPRVEIHADGKLVFSEDYSDIRTDVGLDDALFDATKWKSARHWTMP